MHYRDIDRCPILASISYAFKLISVRMPKSDVWDKGNFDFMSDHLTYNQRRILKTLLCSFLIKYWNDFSFCVIIIPAKLLLHKNTYPKKTDSDLPQKSYIGQSGMLVCPYRVFMCDTASNNYR